ncbi:hypothetical protein SESBI_04192 [Sesbania bispinosa]|nr:hypothetical protein SESBI_04192 [Sesbania bispinosa]
MKRVVREDVGLKTMKGTNVKKEKISLCGSMLIDEFLKENGEVGEEEELGDESANEEENFMEQEENAQKEGGETNENTIEGTSKKRTRGPTQCLKVHARDKDDRQEVILDDDGEPIGPNGQIVSELSHFLGTIARNTDFCPLIYTNFKALVKDKEAQIWGYGNV